jgi:hypothetical protein
MAGTTEEGNIFIDSGTTLTYIPPELYEDLVSALEKAIDAERVSEPGASLCLSPKMTLMCQLSQLILLVLI